MNDESLLTIAAMAALALPGTADAFALCFGVAEDGLAGATRSIGVLSIPASRLGREDRLI